MKRELYIFGLLLLILYEGGGTKKQSRLFNRVRKFSTQQKQDICREINFPMFGLSLDKCSLSRDAFRREYDGKYPVVLCNAFEVEGESWTEQLITKLGDEPIEFDVRTSSTGNVESFSSSLSDFLSAVGGSNHEQSVYLMNEHVLEKASDLMEKFLPDSDYFGKNRFEHFPDKIRPKTALIIGGLGARSFLHADPFEWTGWNHLLEGRKLWIFFPPDDHQDIVGEGELTDLFKPVRNVPDAWGAYNVSAGWVSDVDLYKVISKTPSSAIAEILSADVAGEQRKNQFYTFASGDMQVDRGDKKIFRNVVFVVQEEGDTVFIPPKWWHQVYHLQPSIALAAQYMNEVVESRVLSHILSWTGSNSADLPENFASMSDQEKIQCTLKVGLFNQHGHEKGSLYLKELYGLKYCR